MKTSTPQSFVRISLILFIFLTLTSKAHSQEADYTALRKEFSSCEPQARGGIVDRLDIDIKFFFLTDLCSKNGGRPTVQHTIKNLHPSMLLVYNWQKAFMWRSTKAGLPPDPVKGIQINTFETRKAKLDENAPISYTPSLRREQPASAYTPPPDKNPVAEGDKIASSIKTVILDYLGKLIGVKFEISSTFNEGKIIYEVSTEPADLLFGIGAIPSLAPKALEQFETAYSKFNGHVEPLTLSERFTTAQLNERQLPVAFHNEALWAVQVNQDKEQGAPIAVEVTAEAAQEAVAPIVIMNDDGIPMLTGVASLFAPM